MRTVSDDSLILVDENNIDEWHYRISGYTHRGPLWKRWMRTKWWVKGMVEKLKTPKGEIKFALLDLQRMNLIHRRRLPMRLRFLDKDGILKSAWFIVSYKYGNYYIKEGWIKSVRLAGGTKGPMTFKKALRVQRHVTFRGFVNTWTIPHEKTI